MRPAMPFIICHDSVIFLTAIVRWVNSKCTVYGSYILVYKYV